MKRPPPPDLTVILTLFAFPVLMYVVLEAVKAALLPPETGLNVLTVIAAVSAPAYTVVAAWWIIADPAKPRWKPKIFGRGRKETR